MRGKIGLLLLAVLVLAMAGGCAGERLSQGKYVDESGLWWVLLHGNDEFEFQRGVTSYRPRGSYSIEGDVLILTVSAEEEYRFAIISNRQISFQSGERAHTEPGTVFTLIRE